MRNKQEVVTVALTLSLTILSQTPSPNYDRFLNDESVYISFIQVVN